MDVFNYAPMTGEYLGRTEADPSPNEEGKFIIPAAGTIIEPPDAGENEIAVWTGEEWELQADYRGQTFYNTEDGSLVSFELGDIPGDATQTPRPDPAAVWTGTEWQIPLLILIEKKRTEITNERTERIASAKVFFKGYYFDADQVTQGNLSSTLMAVNSGIYTEPSITWRTADDESISLAITELPTLGALMFQVMNTFYGVSWTLKDQLTPIAEMEYDDAIEALNALVWP